MSKLIDAIIKKWFCCHEWELIYDEPVEITKTTTSDKFNFCGEDSTKITKKYTIRHYFCKKCGKYLRITKDGASIK